MDMTTFGIDLAKNVFQIHGSIITFKQYCEKGGFNRIVMEKIAAMGASAYFKNG